MADLDIKQTETLRAELQERYELDIEAEITAIVFVEGNGNKAKFTCEDTWKEPEPPKQHKPEYRLYIYEKSLREEPGVIPVGALDEAMTAFVNGAY